MKRAHFTTARTLIHSSLFIVSKNAVQKCVMVALFSYSSSPEVDDLFEGLAWPQTMEASICFVVSNDCGKLPAVVHGPHAKRVSATVVDDNIVAFGNVHW